MTLNQLFPFLILVILPILSVVVLLIYRRFSEARAADANWIPPEGLNACTYCAGYHDFSCPYIESIEYEGPDIKRVVFRAQHYKDLRGIVLWGNPPDDVPVPVLEGVVISAPDQ